MSGKGAKAEKENNFKKQYEYWYHHRGKKKLFFINYYILMQNKWWFSKCVFLNPIFAGTKCKTAYTSLYPFTSIPAPDGQNTHNKNKWG